MHSNTGSLLANTSTCINSIYRAPAALHGGVRAGSDPFRVRAAGGVVGVAAMPGGGLIVVFDWDCTVTSRHLYKILAGWSAYCGPFSDWCVAQDIPDPIKIPMRHGSIVERMAFGGGEEGDEMLRRAFCDYMMGGEARIASIKELLVELHTVHGCTLCVLTRGETASLRVVFDKVLPDWAPLFEGGWVANTANEYFTCDASGMLSEQMSGLTTGGASKENMLEQLFPFDSHTVLLVDDSISRGSRLVSSTTPGELGGGVIHLLDLPLEQRGLDGPSMAMLRQVVAGEGGLAELAHAQKASAEKAELKVLTLNVWFDDHGHEARGQALCSMLLDSGADIVLLQEVLPRLVVFFSAHPDISKAFALSSEAVDASKHTTSGGCSPYGCLILIRRELGPAKFAVTELPTKMDRTLVTASLEINGCSFTAATVHLESLAAQPLRKQQLAVARRILGEKEAKAGCTILGGDFNFDSRRDWGRCYTTESCGVTSRCENDVLKSQDTLADFHDCWSVLRPLEPGHTFDTVRNRMLQDWHSYEQMRYDRLMFRPGAPGSVVGDWRPHSIELVGTEPISGVDDQVPAELVTFEQALQMSPDEVPRPDGSRQGYPLHLSDHFGLMMSLEWSAHPEEGSQWSLPERLQTTRGVPVPPPPPPVVVTTSSPAVRLAPELNLEDVRSALRPAVTTITSRDGECPTHLIS
jgi:endonuclease/exonuclease/phosphatase family metal-dependent hydrolase